jgi:hypothetical protein
LPPDTFHDRIRDLEGPLTEVDVSLRRESRLSVTIASNHMEFSCGFFWNLMRGSKSFFNRSSVIVMAITCCLAGIILGCGGSGGTGTAPTGNEAVRSASLGCYQSLGAGVAFPFAALVASAPTGSMVKTAALLSPRYAKYAMGLKRTSLTEVSDLGLYTDGGVITGSKDVISYYTDAAGAVSAGQMILTTAAGTFDYASYPAKVTVVVNVTGGNLPCTGTATITFDGPSGTNTMQGTLDLTKNKESVTIDLALSATLAVSGTMNISENSTTIYATNVSGNLGGNLPFDFTIAPQGFAGTGTINLVNSTISLTFTNPKSAGCAVNSSGDLVLTYPDGTSETVNNPLSATLLAGGSTTGSTGTTTSGTTSTTSGGTTTTTTTTGGTSGLAGYNVTQIASGAMAISAVSPNGQMVGQDSKGNFVYWSSPTAAAKALTLTSSATVQHLCAINNSGHILAAATDQQSADLTPLFWSSYAKTPTEMTPVGSTSASVSSQMYLNANDQVLVGYGNLYYASPTSSPISINGLQSLCGISDAGAVCGLGADGSFKVFPSAPPTGTPISNGANFQQGFVGAAGTLALNLGGSISVATPSSYNLTSLQVPTGYYDAWSLGVGPTNQTYGYSYNGDTVIGDLWTSNSAQPLTFQGVGKYATNVVLFETSSGGLIIGADNGPIAGPYSAFYYLTPK